MIHSDTKVDNRLLKLYKVRRAERSKIKIDFDSLVDSTNPEPNTNRDTNRDSNQDTNRDTNRDANNLLVDDSDRDDNWFYEDHPPLVQTSTPISATAIVVAPESDLIARKQTEEEDESCNNID